MKWMLLITTLFLITGCIVPINMQKHPIYATNLGSQKYKKLVKHHTIKQISSSKQSDVPIMNLLTGRGGINE